MSKPTRKPVPQKFPADIDDREVPAFVPALGQSANDAAKVLGWRLLSLSEARDPAKRATVIGAIINEGRTVFAVAA